MKLGILCALLAGALWGGIFLAPQRLAAFSPWEIALGHYLVYGLAAFTLIIAPRAASIFARLQRSDVYALVRFALTGNVFYFILLSYGVQNAGIAAASLIIGMLPVTITLRGRKDQNAVPLRRLTIPLLMVAIGVACINLDLFRQSLAANVSVIDRLLGIVYTVGALISWTWYAVANARYLQCNSRFNATEWSALYGFTSGLAALLMALAGHAAFGLFDAADHATQWRTFWTVITMLALCSSLIGNQLWNVTSRRLPVTLTGQMIVFTTLFALLYGFCYDQRWPRPLEWLAMVLLISGVLVAVRMHLAPTGKHQTSV